MTIKSRKAIRKRIRSVATSQTIKARDRFFVDPVVNSAKGIIGALLVAIARAMILAFFYGYIILVATGNTVFATPFVEFVLCTKIIWRTIRVGVAGPGHPKRISEYP